MEESADALARAYPDDLPRSQVQDHIEDLLGRFQNRALADTVHRVGRDLYRRLGRDDRLIGAMRLAAAKDCACGGNCAGRYRRLGFPRAR